MSHDIEEAVHAGSIRRFDPYPASALVNECKLHYQNYKVDDIYDQWDKLIPKEQEKSMEKLVLEFYNSVLKMEQEDAFQYQPVNVSRAAKGSFHLESAAESIDQTKSYKVLYEQLLKMCMKKYKIHPRKAMILHMYRRLVSDRILQPSNLVEDLLTTKTSKSDSGVLVITVLTSPYPTVDGRTQAFSCKWNCYYCPNQPGQPRSYLRDEPAVIRANQNGFDPVLQFVDRAVTLAQNGHPIDKVELLILGGTWSSYPYAYQISFIRDLFYAANTFGYTRSIRRKRQSLNEEKHINESAFCKIIGITIETRPDTICRKELKRLRYMGCTRVQLGIQHTDDCILKKINRQSTFQDSINAIRLLKEACFKIDIHLMPNLPGSSPQKDIDMFEKVLQDEGLQVDQWKIYPCEITPWTIIEKWFKNGTYKPYDEETLIKVIMGVKERVHPWIRLNRVIRDIPTTYILAGMSAPNLRQVIADRMKAKGKRCRCIRCREIGSTKRDNSKPVPIQREYKASGGTEFFLSFEKEDESKIYGFLRLRIQNVSKKQLVFKELDNAALVRELHIYGKLVQTNKTSKRAITAQHTGLGKMLMLQAEKIARANGKSKLAVISGVGTRNYYRKLGYVLREGDGEFMIKDLNANNRSRVVGLCGIFILILVISAKIK